MSEYVEITRRGTVQIIRMNREDKKNAITRDMYAAMSAALRASDKDPDIRCNVIFGVPGAFSSGNDMADFMAVAMGGEQISEVFDFLLSMAESETPLLSGVDGIAVGIGTTINLHCDMTFATPRTAFHTPFVNMGLIPEAGSTLTVPRLLGNQRAFAMLGLGEPLSAEDAHAAGMIYKVVGPDELKSTVLEAAEIVASKPLQALKIARDLIRGGRAEVVERIKKEGALFAQRLTSDEARSAFAAFMGRKK